MAERVVDEDLAVEREDVEGAEEPSSETGEREHCGERMVPLSESVRYRRRAQAAERRYKELEERLSGVRGELERTREALDSAERRRQIDLLLIEAEARDLEAARLLTEAAVAQMDEVDVEAAVSELRRRKPYLFRSVDRGGSPGGRSQRYRGGAGDQLDEAAAEAAVSGNRRDLLRYLRLRRGGRGNGEG